MRLVLRDHSHVLRVAARELEVGHAHLEGALVRRQLGRHARELPQQRAHGVVGQRFHQVVLAVEVLVERAGAEASAARDLAQAEVGGAALEQHLARRREDLLAGLAMMPLTAADHQLDDLVVMMTMARRPVPFVSHGVLLDTGRRSRCEHR